MNIKVKADRIEKIKTGGAVIFLFEDEKPGPAVERVDRLLGGTIARLLKEGDFKPKPGALHFFYSEGRIAAERVALAGLGKRTDLTLNRLRHAAGKAANTLRAYGAADVAIGSDGIGPDAEETAQALVEGSVLGLYRFVKYKTKEENSLKKDITSIMLVTEKASNLKDMQKGAKIGSSDRGIRIHGPRYGKFSPVRYDPDDYRGKGA